jgi:hypothetical protein
MLFLFLLLVLLGDVVGAGLARRADWQLQQLRQSLVVLLQQPQCPQCLVAGSALGGIGKLAGGLGMLVDGDRRVGRVRRNRGGSGVVVRLDGQLGTGCWLLAAEHTLVRGDDSILCRGGVALRVAASEGVFGCERLGVAFDDVEWMAG